MGRLGRLGIPFAAGQPMTPPRESCAICHPQNPNPVERNGGEWLRKNWVIIVSIVSAVAFIVKLSINVDINTESIQEISSKLDTVLCNQGEKTACDRRRR